ncbi:MAG: septum formation initiator family protein [Blastocatellia bacterium]|jgi:cell division protein FtsB|nr:septum formation initiator family protein [Blastocatellia bacterium]
MRAKRRTTKATRTSAKRPPLWVGVVFISLFALMIGLTVNYKAYSKMSGEMSEHDQLNQKIQSLMDENLQLQDEIHSLKTDPKVIEREAKRLGIPLGGK